MEQITDKYTDIHSENRAISHVSIELMQNINCEPGRLAYMCGLNKVAF